MKEIDKTQKIDLCNAIIERFKIQNNNSEDLERLNTLFRYFIKDNIENLFGRNLFDFDELEIVKVKEGLVIDSIFGIRLNIEMSNEGSFHIIARDSNTGKVFFRVEMNDKHALNECFVEDHSYRYEIDLNLDKFSYTLMDHNQEVEYSANLQPLGTKRNQFEIFEFKRTIPTPPNEKNKPVLKRIVDRFSGGDLVKIDTGSELRDVVYHAALIFDKLKMEAKKEKYHRKQLKNQD